MPFLSEVVQHRLLLDYRVLASWKQYPFYRR